MTHQEREERALDALIVMALRCPEPDDMDMIDMDLPELTEEERTAMEKIDIEAIIARGFTQPLESQ